jgi:hypothetical protein
MSRARLALGVAVLLLGGWFLAELLSTPGAPSTPERTFTSSAQCRECHAEVFAEWQASQHAITWSNPAVRMLSNDFANQDCIDCHAPRPVFVTGIGMRVLPRAERRVEGVDCIACHELPDASGGGVAGTFDDPRAACRPRATRALATPEFCAGCHNQHKTVDQWRESSWPERGEDCLSCHMPFRDGDPNRGRDHRFLGGYHEPMLQAAVELRGSAAEGVFRVELENVGAGHSFPTDERSRAADLFWRPLAAGAVAEPWRHLYRIRDPYRYETNLQSTLLHADQTLSLEIADAPAGSAIEVALFYKRSPYWQDPEHPDPEREALLVERIEIGP